MTKGRRMRGTMLWFNDEKDLGYITTEAGDRIAVHSSGFTAEARPQNGRCAGTAVEFRVATSAGARTAQDVTLVPDVAPRRARRRHGR